MRRFYWTLGLLVALAAGVETVARFMWGRLAEAHRTSLSPYPINSTVPFLQLGEAYTATTNELGFFDLPVSPRLEGKILPRIAILGDSMTQGFGVPPEQSFPALLQRQLAGNAEVFQFAFVGAGPGHLACVLERLSQQSSFDHVVFVTYLPNDFNDAVFEAQRPCFWWQRNFRQRPSFPAVMHLWRYYTAPLLVSVGEMPAVN